MVLISKISMEVMLYVQGFIHKFKLSSSANTMHHNFQDISWIYMSKLWTGDNIELNFYLIIKIKVTTFCTYDFNIMHQVHLKWTLASNALMNLYGDGVTQITIIANIIRRRSSKITWLCLVQTWFSLPKIEPKTTLQNIFKWYQHTTHSPIISQNTLTKTPKRIPNSHDDSLYLAIKCWLKGWIIQVPLQLTMVPHKIY